MNSPNQIVFGPLPQTTYQQGQPHSAQHHHHNHQSFPPQQTPPFPGAYPGHRGGRFGGGNKQKKPKSLPVATAAGAPQQAAPSATNMAQYDTNPVGALQERFQSRGITPIYRMVQAEGASHCPTFSFQCIIGDMVAMGSGNSKKQAKHNTARAMLDKLDGRVPAHDGLQPLPPVTGVGADGKPLPPAKGGTGNTIGQLQELCVHKGLPMPVYDLGNVEGQPHQRSFTIKCRVGTVQVNGAGTSKKDAKRDAATKMLDELNNMTQGQFATVEKDGKISKEDEELVKNLSNLKVNVDTLTPEHSQKIQQFYRNLQDAKGAKLFALHKTSLKNKQGDYVRLLTELGSEQKFEVTYVEIDEKPDEREVHCLVQLSTLPVAVCYGVGQDKTKAHNDAARNALSYLKIMTKKPQQVQNGK